MYGGMAIRRISILPNFTCSAFTVGELQVDPSECRRVMYGADILILLTLNYILIVTFGFLTTGDITCLS